MRDTIKRILVLVALATVTVVGVAVAQNVDNYFTQSSGSNNALVLNGDVSSESVRLPTTATFTVGTESGDNIDTQIVFKDGSGDAIAYPFKTYCWASEATTGAGYVTTAATAVFSAVTNGFVESRTSGKSADVVSSAAGLLGVRDTQSSATSPDAYLCCALALGRTACSGAINH